MSPASTPIPDFGFAERSERHAGQEPAVLERTVVPVDPELVLFAVVGDVEIDPAVTVEVGGGNAKRRPELRGEPGRARHVRERAVAVIAVQAGSVGRDRPSARSTRGCPMCRSTACSAQGPRSGSGRRRDRASRRDRSPRTPPTHSTASARSASRRDVGEDAAAVIAQQPVAVERRDIQVHATVIVDSRRRPRPCHRPLSARPLCCRDVGERRRRGPVGAGLQVVAEQPVCEAGSCSDAAALKSWLWTRNTSRSPSPSLSNSAAPGPMTSG